MTRIDAHHHMWDLAVRDQPWIAGPSMAAIRRTFTIDDLRPSAQAAGIGIRHQVQSEPDPDWLRRPDVIRGLRTVAAVGLCYDLVVLPHQIPAASYAAAAVPGLTLVLDHAGKPQIASGELRDWDGGRPRVRRAAEHGVQAVGAGDRGTPRRQAASVRTGRGRGA